MTPRDQQGQGRSADRGGGPRRDSQGRTRNRGQSGGPRQYSATAPRQRRRSADPARLTAYEVLRAVSADDAYANLVLPQRIAQHRLDQRDAGFATELTYGALRGQGFYDAVLAECVDRPLAQLDAPVLDALRLGAHQLLGMRVKAHAALDSTVGLVRDQIGAGPSGLVNAVLRKVAVHDREQWLARVAPEDSGEAAQAIRHSHPQWIVRALRQSLVAHGRPAEEITDVLEADNAAPVLNLVALPGLGDLGPVLAHGAEPGPLAPDSALFSGGDAGRVPGVREGTVRVQDVGSQLMARALADVHRGNTPEGGQESWLDLCAGPGGKAALLAALAAQRGAHVVANEVAAHRSRLVEQALSAVPPESWSIRTGDGKTIADDVEHRPAGGFHRILVDAPCTGLGALRRRPESRWRRRPSDLAPLTDLQRELLDSAVGVLAPGGILAYVTCSPHPAETVVQAQDLLRRHPQLELIDAPDALMGIAPALDRSTIAGPDGPGTAQLWPHLHATDAMFLALFRARPSGPPAAVDTVQET